MAIPQAGACGDYVWHFSFKVVAPFWDTGLVSYSSPFRAGHIFEPYSLFF